MTRPKTIATRASNTLFVVAKTPVAGRVKTRLVGADFHDADAARLAGAFLRDTAALASHPELPDRMVLALDGDPADLPALLPLLPTVPQGKGDLGERLTRLFADAFAVPGTAAVCAIGSDTPHLPAAFVIEAFGRLASPTVDAVVGRADDGGYYLVGMNRFCPELFAEIDWGTATVHAQTVARAAAANLRIALLPPWYDVDTPGDVDRLRRDLVLGVVTAPGTAAVLSL